MPDNTRRDMPTTQSFTLGDKRFIGIDTNLPANSLDVGFLQDVNNLWVDGVSLTPRPGWQGQLTTALASPIHAITAYRTADGSSNRLFYVSGNSVHMHTVGAATSTALSGTGTWTDSAQVRLKQHGRYIYGVPGKDGTAMFRVDGTQGVPVLETIPQLSSPTVNGTDLVKPIPTQRTIKLRGISSQKNDVQVVVTLGTSLLTVSGGLTHSFAIGDRVKFVTSTVANITAGQTYFVISSGLSSTQFRISTTLNGSVLTPTNGTGGTFRVAYANDIDNYYLLKGVADFAKPVVTNFPTVWSNNLMKNGAKGNNDYTSIPAGEFDSYPQTDNIGPGGDITINQDWSGNVAVDCFTFRESQNGQWKADTSQILKSPSTAPTYSEPKAWLVIRGTGTYAEHIVRGLPTETWLPGTTPTTMGLYNLQFYTLANVSKSQGFIKFNITVWGQDSAGQDIPGCVFSNSYQQAVGVSSTDWMLRDIIVDFREFAPTLDRIRMRFTNETSQGGQELLLDMVRLFACQSAVVASGEYATPTVNETLAAVRYSQLNPSLSLAKASYLKKRRLRIISEDDSQLPLVLKQVNAVSFRWIFNPDVVTETGSYPSVKLGLQVGSVIRWSSIGIWDQTREYMTFNLFGLTEAEKTNVSFMYLEFQSDVLKVSGLPFAQNELVFGIGEMGSDFGLSDQSIYEYAFSRWFPRSASEYSQAPSTELADGSYSKGFESELSDISTSITATSALSSVSISLNPNNDVGYGSNLTIDKRPLVAVSDATDRDQWLSTYVPGVNQIRVVTTNTSTPTFSYVAADNTNQTVAAGSFSTIAAPDGTTYKVYSIPATNAGRIKYITSIGSGTYWMEHAVPYGYANDARYSYVLVYRRNNILFPDGSFRLIAAIPITDSPVGNVTYTGSGWSATYNTTTNRTITLTDSVPDSNLFYSTVPYTQGWIYEISRNNMPLGASSLATFQNRLWVSKANTIYASWTIDATDEYKLYTSIAPDLTDPAVARKGASFTVGGAQEKEIVQALVPTYDETVQQSNTTTSSLLVLKENSVSTILGFDPTTFTVQLWVGSAGVGIAAPMSAVNADGSVMWLGVNGMSQWSGNNVVPRSTELRKLVSLDPSMGGPANISKDQYRKSICVMANRRLFLLTTSSGAASANQTVYVFDGRTKGWVRWTNINSLEFTGLGVLSMGDDIQYVYAGSASGQLFRLSGDKDLLTPSSTGPSTAIPWSLTTRQHGQAYSEAPTYYQYNRPYQLDLHVQNVDGLTYVGPFTINTMSMDWYVENQSGPYNASTSPDGVSTTGTVQFTTKTDRSIAIRNLGRDVKGHAIQMRLSGLTIGKFFIRAIHVHMYDGGIRRY